MLKTASFFSALALCLAPFAFQTASATAAGNDRAALPFAALTVGSAAAAFLAVAAVGDGIEARRRRVFR